MPPLIVIVIVVVVWAVLAAIAIKDIREWMNRSRR